MKQLNFPTKVTVKFSMGSKIDQPITAMLFFIDLIIGNHAIQRHM